MRFLIIEIRDEFLMVKDILSDGQLVISSYFYAECRECHYTKCRYAQCRGTPACWYGVFFNPENVEIRKEGHYA